MPATVRGVPNSIPKSSEYSRNSDSFPGMGSQQVAFGPFVLDHRLRLLWRDGERVVIGDKALTLLSALLQKEGQIVTKAELIDAATLSR